MINIEIHVGHNVIFPGIDEIINIPGIIQMVERIAIRKTNHGPTFPYFRTCHNAS
jgi:hypothetical protein